MSNISTENCEELYAPPRLKVINLLKIHEIYLKIHEIYFKIREIYN